MKKLSLTLIIVIMLISIIPFNTGFSLHANSYYSYGCSSNEFEVSYINDDGTFSKISCHSTFSEAKKAMKQDDDYVVRYSKSYSPTMIVAMNSGLVYSYPGRSNSSTMNIYQNPNAKDDSRYKQTYVSNHYEMTYVKTCSEDVYDMKPNGRGYVQVVLNGFEGFADLEYTDLVPSKFIRKSIPIWLGGRNVYEDEDPFQVKAYQSYYEIKKNGNYYDLVFTFYRAYPKNSVNGADALSSSYSVDNAANYLEAGMKTGVKYYSSDGINFYSDMNLDNKVATVYNYYQFLPLRTSSNIIADNYDDYISYMKGSSSVLSGQGKYFVRGENQYGFNSLIVYAMACLESAYGTSGYAKNRNNLFGWTAYDDSPDDASYFSSVKTCVYEHMGRNLNWFLDFTNRRYFGYCVGNKGAGLNVNYASDPYWGSKIASIAYAIDKYSCGSNGNLKDHNNYTLAFVKDNYNDVIYSSNIEWDSNFYKTASGGSVLFTGRYGSHYQKDLVVALIEKSGNRYKVQTPNPLENSELVTRDGMLDYDWDNSVAYIDLDKVIQLNNKSKPIDETTPTSEATYANLMSLREVNLEDGKLSFSGIGAIQGMNFVNTDEISHVINFRSITDNEIVFSMKADTVDSDSFSNNDGYDYKYAGFYAVLNLSDNNLPAGSYYIELVTSNKDKTVSGYLYSANKDFRMMAYNGDDNSYVVKMNDYYNYRFEFEISAFVNAIDFTDVIKPSARPSVVSLDDITLSDEGQLMLIGHAFMYYLDYVDTNKISYQIILVSDKDRYLEIDCELFDDRVDYTKELQSKYKLDHICFRCSKDISQLPSGKYTVYLKMSNSDSDVTYTDINEIINYGFNMPSITINEKEYSLVTSILRKRIELNIIGE